MYNIGSQKNSHMKNAFIKKLKIHLIKGGNIPLDLEMEHCIRLIKTIKRKLGPNYLNENVMTRYFENLVLLLKFDKGKKNILKTC